MYIEPDDAKTDVILAAAVAVIGPSVVGFVSRLPLVPRTGALGVLIGFVFVLATTALVPVLLARHRGDGLHAFGMREAGGSLNAVGTSNATAGSLLMVVPVAVAGAGTVLLLGGSGSAALLGRVGMAIGSVADLVAISLTALRLVVLSVATLLLTGFLSVRSRDGFPRSPDTSLPELVRTFGLGAVGVAAVTGVVRALTGGSGSILALNVVALVAVLLLVDRLVPAGITVPRTTVVAPLLVILIVQTFSAGGIFGGGLLLGLHRGALAAGVVIAVAATAATRRGAVLAVPLIIAVHWWPTCLSPLPSAGGLC
ncbi:MAG: hypothetical protein WD638_09880 [Nitriliruptoraceae bacterium]